MKHISKPVPSPDRILCISMLKPCALFACPNKLYDGRHSSLLA